MKPSDLHGNLSEYELKQVLDHANRVEQLNRGRTWHPKQQEVIRAIFREGYKRIFIRKGRKGGGTQTILYPLARTAGLYPSQACYLFGPTLKIQNEIVWANNRVQGYFPREWNPTFKRSESRVVLPNGSFVKVEGANDPELVVGIEGDAFVFDEFKRHNPAAYENCYPNVASRDALWIVCGSPPRKKDHYWKLEQNIKNDPDWFFIHWSVWDNAENLPGGKKWIENEKAAYYRRGDWDIWNSEWEAEYVFQGQNKVLPDFEERRHTLPMEVILERLSHPSQLKFITSIDPGYASCFAVLFAVYDPVVGYFYLLDEIYETDRRKISVERLWPEIEKKQGQIASHFKGQVKWQSIYDSAALGFANTVRDRFSRRIKLMPTVKEKDDEENYLRMANSLFAMDKCFISEDCPKTIFEIENYETDENGNFPDTTNHQLDNFRYCLKRLGVNLKLLERQESSIIIPRGITLEEDMAEVRGKNSHEQLFGEAGDFFDITGGDFDL
jgi:hypothetical protein